MVTAEFCKRKDVYNVIPGGHGGFNHLNSSPLLMVINARKGAESMRRMMMERDGKDWNTVAGKLGGHASMVMKKGIYDPAFTPNNFANNPERHKRAILKAASPEVRARVRKTFVRIRHQKGKKNSQYGTVWITNGLESQKAEPRFVGLWELDGWRLGRVMPAKARRGTGCRIIPPQRIPVLGIPTSEQIQSVSVSHFGYCL